MTVYNFEMSGNVIISAENLTDAIDELRELIDMNTGVDFDDVKEVNECDQLPDGWNSDCIPFGRGAMSVIQLLGK